FPIETVEAMRKVILYTQEHSDVEPMLPKTRSNQTIRRNAIAQAACSMAAQLKADVIVAETKEGGTAENIAGCRPRQPIISVTSIPRVAQQLALSYANRSFVRDDAEDAGYNLVNELYQEGFFGGISPLNAVVVRGMQPGVTGGTDTIRACVVE